MARGYIKVGEGGAVDSAAWAIQGHIHELTAEHSFWGKALRCEARGAAPGLYRAKFTSEGGSFASVTRGARVSDASAEAARLRRNAEQQVMSARTGMPGIQGYQKMENAATARLLNNKRESTLLAAWLDGGKK